MYGRVAGEHGQATRLSGTRRWLRLVGEFAVGRGSRRWATTEVGSRKARTLLAILAVEHGRAVSVDRAVEVLWRTAPPRRPAANVATLVSRLRGTLGADAILGRRNAYRLNGAISVDLFEAAELVADAEARLAAEPAAAVAAARRALDVLAAGEVLPEQPEADWVEPARNIHASRLRRARHLVAEGALRTGDLPMAIVAAEAAVVADPIDEAAYRALMRAREAAGQHAAALAAFDQLSAVLGARLGTDPARSTRELRAAILDGRDSVTASNSTVDRRTTPWPVAPRPRS
jgi:DNA-binding SARP family transcriptional activator